MLYNKVDLKELKAVDYSNEIIQIKNILRDEKVVEVDRIICFAFVALVKKVNNLTTVNEVKSHIEELLSDEIVMYVDEYISARYDIAFQIADDMSEEKIAAMILYYNGDEKFDEACATPDSLIELVLKIMDIKPSDKIADLGCGRGRFLTDLSVEYCDNEMFGVEINSSAKAIAAIRLALISKNGVVEQNNMFDIETDLKFDKIFSNYPFGVKYRNLLSMGSNVEKVQKKYFGAVKVSASDWIYNALLLDHITDDGKAIGIMTNGSTWNLIDQKVREVYVKNGWIEAVIALPAKLFASTAIPVTMVVLSKGNKDIRMVDASELVTQGRRLNELSNDNIEAIIRALTEDSEYSKAITVNELAENDYVLNPTRYLQDKIEIESGVEFGSVIKNVTRGAQIKASDLDNMVSSSITDYQYMMLANIKDGIIDEDLPYISEIDKKQEKYLIHNGNLLLSKNGAPYKSAVAEVEDSRFVLANGNLYIITLDLEKINPYYAAAYFESEAGMIALKNASVGATIPNVPLENLRRIMIPLPAMDKQKEIAEKYKMKTDEIKMLRVKLERAISEKKNLIEEEC